jgi:geranylgeranyl diphosphate synthase type II
MQAPIITPHKFEQYEDLIENKIKHICDFEDENSLLSKALEYHFKAGGSRTRSNFTYKFAKSFLVSETDAVALACIPELLHNASLIHDDLQDQDTDRRGHLSVWKKYGADIAICAGDFLISAAYGATADLKCKNIPQIIQKIHSNIHEVVKGQIDDLSQDKNQSLNDISLYERISIKKSGPLLALSLTLPLLYTERASFVSLAEQAFYNYAVAYQIYDDIHDIERDQLKVGSKSGLNIITIMQKNGALSPVKAASDLAIDNLAKASQIAMQLPFPSNNLLEKEIAKMHKKISFIGNQ